MTVAASVVVVSVVAVVVSSVVVVAIVVVCVATLVRDVATATSSAVDAFRVVLPVTLFAVAMSYNRRNLHKARKLRLSQQLP